MTYYYHGRPRMVYNQDAHNLVGALVLFGSLIFVVSLLIFEWEMMVFGSGLMMLGSFGSLCCLENTRKANQLEGITEHQLERGEADSDAE
jgi:hypothetical protein